MSTFFPQIAIPLTTNRKKFKTCANTIALPLKVPNNELKINAMKERSNFALSFEQDSTK